MFVKHMKMYRCFFIQIITYFLYITYFTDFLIQPQSAPSRALNIAKEVLYLSFFPTMTLIYSYFKTNILGGVKDVLQGALADLV